MTVLPRAVATAEPRRPLLSDRGRGVRHQRGMKLGARDDTVLVLAEEVDALVVAAGRGEKVETQAPRRITRKATTRAGQDLITLRLLTIFGRENTARNRRGKGEIATGIKGGRKQINK